MIANVLLLEMTAKEILKNYFQTIFSRSKNIDKIYIRERIIYFVYVVIGIFCCSETLVSIPLQRKNKTRH